MFKLTIELVPQTSWYSNVRSNVPQEDWDIIRRNVYRAARNRCEICGGRGCRHPVECHEVWDYDDENHIQRLARMIALCPACHQVKHIGRTMSRGPEYYSNAIRQLCRVNDWEKYEAEDYINERMQIWAKRSLYPWTLNIDILHRYLDKKEDLEGFHKKLMTGKREDLW